MTTQTTKPEPAIGQRWSDGKNVWVLTERGLDGFRCRHDTDATRISFAMDMWLANGATYLGPTEPGGGDAPRPAKGQRWRDTQPGYGLAFEVTGPMDTRGWRVRCVENGNMTWWENEDFRNGTLVFVDHGEPASHPSQPRTGPGKGLTNPECSHPRCVGKETCAVPAPRAPEPDPWQQPPLTVYAILQAKERARQEKREADARAVAAFCSDFDLLPDAP